MKLPCSEPEPIYALIDASESMNHGEPAKRRQSRRRKYVPTLDPKPSTPGDEPQRDNGAVSGLTILDTLVTAPVHRFDTPI